MAHEIGHHLQRDFAGGVYQSRFKDVIEQAATTAGAPAGPWEGWHEEVFADVCSVLLTGPAGALATVEMLRDSTARMFSAGKSYPALVVRRRLMRGVLSAGGLTDAAVPRLPPVLDDGDLGAVDEPLRAAVDPHRAAADRVAAAVMQQPVNGHVLPRLLGWRAQRHTGGGEVQFWRDELLRADAEPLPEELPHTARTVLAGGVAAWQETVRIDDPGAREEARFRLAERLRTLLTKSRSPGKRAGPVAGAAPDATSAPLVGALFNPEIEREI
ncbi:hypothetical protein [Plantactinospora sp. KBS50]|uniref:hypothetical protein n=1 Tax=Plantactinospora sp. KBS50 TaxID=2024580 RepID=UPI000BAAE6FF|nr:hypothetical protein [Plantactinospora sp. KBS50]ASW55785.1 hypothetical protein CIK06_18795 [Plantactinospora sp. KBS50]